MPNDFNYRPDFEAEMRLPEWLQMGNEQQMNVSPFVDALKKRMTKPPDSGNLGASLGGEMNPKSGGMKSL